MSIAHRYRAPTRFAGVIAAFVARASRGCLSLCCALVRGAPITSEWTGHRAGELRHATAGLTLGVRLSRPGPGRCEPGSPPIVVMGVVVNYRRLQATAPEPS